MLLFSETMSEPDRSFMEAFYTQYRVLLYSIALRYTEQKETAEDLVQDALIQLMRHVDTLQTLSENARVMYGVCTLKSVACNWLRRNKRIVPWNTAMEESEPEGGRPGSHAGRALSAEGAASGAAGAVLYHAGGGPAAARREIYSAQERCGACADVWLQGGQHPGEAGAGQTSRQKGTAGGGGCLTLSGENRQQLLENYEDALFALLMDDFAEREGEKLKAENERLKQDPAAQPPEELDQKCRRIIRAEYAKAQRKRLAHSAGSVFAKVFTRIAVAAAVISVLCISAYAAFPAVRRAALNTVIEITDRAAIFTFTDRAEDETEPSEREDQTEKPTLANYQITWLPEGYTEVDTQINRNYQDATYAGDDTLREFIMLTLFTGSGPVLSVDTENAQIERVLVNGNDAMLVIKGNSIKVLWTDEKTGMFLCVLTRNISEESALTFARGLIPLDRETS